VEPLTQENKGNTMKLTNTLEIRFDSRKTRNGNAAVIKVVEPSKGERAKRVVAKVNVGTRKTVDMLKQYENAFRSLKEKCKDEVSPGSFDFAWGVIISGGMK
jgi:DUF971 family protein